MPSPRCNTLTSDLHYGESMVATVPLVPRVGVAAVAALVVALTLTGCGSSAEPRADQPVHPDQATIQCRTAWKSLSDSLRGHDERADPSDLASRWTPVIATVGYYVITATAQDCPDALNAQKAANARIEKLSARLRPFDISHRMSSLAPVATDYLTTAGKTLQRTRGRGHRKAPQPPSKKTVSRALRTLQDQTAAAVSDMQDGWSEADAVDLTDPAAVRKVLSDLGFLAADSAPFQACLKALRVLEQLQAAASVPGTPGTPGTN